MSSYGEKSSESKETKGFIQFILGTIEKVIKNSYIKFGLCEYIFKILLEEYSYVEIFFTIECYASFCLLCLCKMIQIFGMEPERKYCYNN